MEENRERRLAYLAEREEKERIAKEEEITPEILDQLAEVKDGITNMLKLQTSGYSKGQIKILLPLLSDGYPYDEIISLFTPEMQKGEMKIYMEYINKKESNKGEKNYEAI